MPKASVKRLIDNRKDKLIEFVLDIEKYPEFVPFCQGSKVHERKQKGEGFVIHFSKEISLPSELQKGVDKMNNEFEKWLKTNLNTYELVKIGSSLKFCLLAEVVQIFILG